MAAYRAPMPNIISLLSLEGEAFVRQAYKRLLNREADPSGLTSCLEQLRAGVPKENILAAMESTPEGRLAVRRRGGMSFASQVAEATAPPKPQAPAPADVHALLALEPREFLLHAYVLVVGRNADREGLQSLSARLAAGTTSAEVLLEIAQSDEAKAFGRRLAGLSDWLRSSARPAGVPAVADVAALFAVADDAAFLNAAYWHVLGRPADAPGSAQLGQQMAAGTTRERILQEMAASAEGVAAGRDGLPGLAEWLEAGAPPAQPQSPQPGNVQELLSLHGREFLLHAYPLVVGRNADREGLESLSTRMAAGLTREETLREMSMSEEAAAYGHRMAGLSEWLNPSQRPADVPDVADVAELLAIADDRSFLNATYWHVLGRIADREGLESLLTHMAAGLTREVALREISMSEEAAAYGHRLAGLSGWLDPSQRPADVPHIADVVELLAIADDRSFLSATYWHVLGRPADPPGLAHLEQLVNTGTPREAILNGIATSEEGQAAGHERLPGLAQWLASAPGSGEPDPSQAVQETAQAVADVNELLAIADEGLFLRSAYSSVLGRPVDQEGLDNCKSLLARGWSRLYVLNGLRNSDEARRANTKLRGLDQRVRNYRMAQKRSLLGWYLRSVLGTVSDLPADRQLRELYRKLGG